ncbi:hypothetical protein [Nostoc sp. ATCC 53789]|uniref:hypothetical protein n=1 Tax=Nostoc sp. ATCC 53789 TaxID=76335 RepID=UPI0011BFBCCE|nr:hypothetical protein [Nostoc sp. ATCC 53789]QHG17083.1 hypothetical protein GJB62_14615 [Nostoc sp. ATCC 53789]
MVGKSSSFLPMLTLLYMSTFTRNFWVGRLLGLEYIGLFLAGITVLIVVFLSTHIHENLH